MRLEFPRSIIQNLENLKLLENSSNERQTVNYGKTFEQTVRTSKQASNLQKSCEDSSFLTNTVADITFLSIRSKQLYTRCVGCQEVIDLGKNQTSILILKFSHSNFHSCILWLHLLLRHYYFLSDTSRLLQAKEHKVR